MLFALFSLSLPLLKKRSKTKSMKILYVFLFVVALLMSPFAHAGKAEDIAQVEKYLQQLDTAQARFTQTAHDGTQLTGTFYLDRPGKLRFEYDDPIEDFVVSDGFFIYFYDAELKEQTNAPIGQTLADFILRSDVTLSGDIQVDLVKRGGGYLQIALSQSSDPQAGNLMLALKENKGGLELRKWRVIDPQGLITEVELHDLETGVEFPSGLFAYVDPEHGQRPSYND